MDSDELAREAVRMNRAIVRCLHHLAAELPEEKQGDFLLLLNDIQSKNMKMADALRCPKGLSDNDDQEKHSA
ncbi:MAG: hypothetical protein JWQ10_1787 [Herbaspirillum sp.]|jgi:hypothetical protein|nr:hypothetical protein [Herbaspirillum sp.]